MVGSGKKEENMVVFSHLLYCELSVSEKEGPDRKKNTFEYLRISTDLETVYINRS